MHVQSYAPPKPAPPFSLPDLEGKLHSLGDFRGKVLMLFFWATW
jgi:peroxiredoxin